LNKNTADLEIEAMEKKLERLKKKIADLINGSKKTGVSNPTVAKLQDDLDLLEARTNRRKQIQAQREEKAIQDRQARMDRAAEKEKAMAEKAANDAAKEADAKAKAEERASERIIRANRAAERQATAAINAHNRAQQDFIRESDRAAKAAEKAANDKIKAEEKAAAAAQRTADQEAKAAKKASQDEIKAAEEARKATENKIDSMGKRIKSFGDTVKRVLISVGLVGSLRSIYTEMDKDIEGAKLLENAFSNIKVTDAQQKSILDFGKSIQSQFGIALDEYEDAMSRLLTFTGSGSVSDKLKDGLVDMAQATGKTLDDVASAIGRSFTTGLGTLRRYGISVSQDMENQ